MKRKQFFKPFCFLRDFVSLSLSLFTQKRQERDFFSHFHLFSEDIGKKSLGSSDIYPDDICESKSGETKKVSNLLIDRDVEFLFRSERITLFKSSFKAN
jgi:hypothetical protein